MADRYVEEMTKDAVNPFAGADHDDDEFEVSAEARGDVLPEMSNEQENPVQSAPEQEPAETGTEPEAEGAEAGGEPAGTEPESEPEPEPEAAEPESEHGERDRSGIQIPKARLDQEVRKRRALEAQLEEMRNRLSGGGDAGAGSAGVPDNQLTLDFGESAKNMFDMVLDGQLDKATELFNQAMQTAVTHAAKTAQQNTTGEIKRQTEMERFSARIDEIVAEYPILDSTNPDMFDKDLCERVNMVRDGFLSRGYRMTDALDEAVSMVLHAERPELFAPAQTQEPEPAPVKPQPKPVNVQKNLKTAAQQPPRLSDAGSSVVQHAAPNVFELDDPSFEALSETELAKMRGDFG